MRNSNHGQSSDRGALCILQRSVPMLVLTSLSCTSGCMRPWLCSHGDAGPSPMTENPLFVPSMHREFLWNQTVDAVDDYFRIEREEGVRLIAGVLTEGRIDTFAVTGSTIL